MIEIMFPRTVSNILDYDAIKAAAKKYVEDAFIDIIASFGDNLVLQTMDEEHLSVVSEHVAGNPTLTLQELLDYINTDNVYKEKEFVDGLSEHFGSHVEYKLLEGHTIHAHDHTPLTTGYGKAGVIILNVDDTASVINSQNGMTAIDEWVGENAASKLPINLYIEFQNNFNVNGNRPGETTPAYWRSYPYIEDEIYVTNDPYYHVEPAPEPTPPTPVEEWEDYYGTRIAFEISVDGTSMSNAVATRQGLFELDLTQYRINPAVMDMEANGYDFVALAKLLANNKLYHAFLSMAKVSYVIGLSNYPGEPGTFQFNRSSPLGNSSDACWNATTGFPLKFENNNSDVFDGFIVNYSSTYQYPSGTLEIKRTDSTPMNSSAIGGGSYTDGCFRIDENVEDTAETLLNTYIENYVDGFAVNADSGKPIVLDYDQSTGKLGFYFMHKYEKWEATAIKGSESPKFGVIFRLGGTYNGHAIIQRYVGSTPLTPPVPTAPQLKTAFMRSANYQNVNKSVAANSSEALYDDGASITLLVDGSKTYTLLRAYNKDNTELDITGASLSLTASGDNYQLKLNWGATAAQICYIEYSVS